METRWKVSWCLWVRQTVVVVAGQVRRRVVNLVKLLTTPQPLQWHPSAGLDLGTDKTSLSNIILGRESGLKEDRYEKGNIIEKK